ncbi:MAG TPA: NAD-binding protein [Acidimicrobiia bacterium]|nr:NAD-binding protein [Acidimicrobiia bacterium]
MRIVIAGCGRVGANVAKMLVGAGHDVTVVDRSEEALETLGRAFNGTVVLGEAYDVDTLREAGIELADVFLAVTDSDNANLMASEVAKAVFDVPRSIARLYDPAREETYHALDIHHVTGTKLIANVLYEQIMDEEFAFHVTFPKGDVEVVEFHLSEAADGMRVDQLEIDHELRIAAIQRGEVTVIPKDELKLRGGDLVVAAAREGVRSRIHKYVTEKDR